MREMEEERANMREHVMKEVDTDKAIVQNLFIGVDNGWLLFHFIGTILSTKNQLSAFW